MANIIDTRNSLITKQIFIDLTFENFIMINGQQDNIFNEDLFKSLKTHSLKRKFFACHGKFRTCLKWDYYIDEDC